VALKETLPLSVLSVRVFWPSSSLSATRGSRDRSARQASCGFDVRLDAVHVTFGKRFPFAFSELRNLRYGFEFILKLLELSRVLLLEGDLPCPVAAIFPRTQVSDSTSVTRNSSFSAMPRTSPVSASRM